MAQASFSKARVISNWGRGLIGLAMLRDTDSPLIICANGSPKRLPLFQRVLGILSLGTKRI